MYQEIDLPYVRLLFDAATRGVLVDGGELERSPNAQELKPILRRRDLRTGRVRASYRWATNGRAYANRPSLQNLHREDRAAVIAPPGHRLVYADLRAADLAALAGLSGDRNLLAQFEPGEDIHAFTARLAAGSGSPERNIGKALNLASLYGAGTSAIAEKGRMTYDEAGRFEKKFWSTIRRAREWCDGVFVRVLEPPHELRNPFGRLACFGLDVADGIDLDTLRRRVISFAVSSTASDAFKVNLLRLAGVLPQGAHVVLPMHDGVLLEVPDEELERVVKACFQEMTVPISQVPIPLGVKVEVGANWGVGEDLSGPTRARAASPGGPGVPREGRNKQGAIMTRIDGSITTGGGGAGKCSLDSSGAPMEAQDEARKQTSKSSRGVKPVQDDGSVMAVLSSIPAREPHPGFSSGARENGTDSYTPSTDAGGPREVSNGDPEDQENPLVQSSDSSQERPTEAPREPRAQTDGEAGFHFVGEAEVKLDDIVLGTDPLVRNVDREHLESLVAALEAGCELPPLVVDEALHLVDGRHRYDAFVTLEQETVKVEVFKYASEAAEFLHAVQLNSAHGLPLSGGEKKTIGKRLFAEGLDSKRIASTMSVTARTVDLWTKEARDATREGNELKVAERLGLGNSQASIAAELGMTSGKIRSIVGRLRKSSKTTGQAIQATLDPEDKRGSGTPDNQVPDTVQHTGCAQEAPVPGAAASAPETPKRESVLDRLAKIKRLIEDTDLDVNLDLLEPSPEGHIRVASEAFRQAVESLLESVLPSGGTGPDRGQADARVPTLSSPAS